MTMIPGSGIGPELTRHVRKVLEAANVPVHFDLLEGFNFEDEEMLRRVKKNQVIMLGGKSPTKSEQFIDNHRFYKELDLYAEVVPCFSMPNVTCRHKNVDIVVIRENTEGEFTGVEHEVYPGVIESLKIITFEASYKIATYAFEHAHLSGRKKVTAVHKANIMKMVDGMFLEACRKVAEKYPFIEYEEMIIDNCSMQLVKNPGQFDVMVLPNLYGSIVENICHGITGGLGNSCGATVGNDHIMFT